MCPYRCDLPFSNILTPFVSHLLATVRVWLPTTGPSLTYQLRTWRTCHSCQRSECSKRWRAPSWRSSAARWAALASWKSPPRVRTLDGGGRRLGGAVAAGSISIDRSAGSRSSRVKMRSLSSPISIGILYAFYLHYRSSLWVVLIRW